MKALRFHPFERSHAQEVLSWRYPAPYDFYNFSGLDREYEVEALIRPELRYYAVLGDKGEMLAFRCFGADGQVPGGMYVEDALDFGGGLRPDLTGRGFGRHFLAAALSFALGNFSPRAFRVTVAAFNERAMKVCLRLGFRRVGDFSRHRDGVPFVIFSRGLAPVWLEIPLCEERPNKAPEPTPTAVTPRALEMKSELKLWTCSRYKARVVPAAGVAHL